MSNKIIKERWQRLAGIVKESSYHMAKHDHVASVVNKHVAGLIKDLELDPVDAPEVFDDLTHNIKRYLSSVLGESTSSIAERTSPEAAQDVAAYFGTNDSVDGPYKKVSALQPFQDAKHRKKFLKAIHAEGALGKASIRRLHRNMPSFLTSSQKDHLN